MITSIQNNSQNPYYQGLSFGAKKNEKKHEEGHDRDTLLINDKGKTPFMTKVGVEAEKFQNAFTVYPAKGLKGSKNFNFYEFLTTGTVPYVLGSLGMMAVFNMATPFFSPSAQKSASNLGKKMALGVLFYGAAKNLSKALIDKPIEMKYGVDVNMPYRKVVSQLPETADDTNLKTHEYHQVFESVDFPRWDLLYGNKTFGEERNAYFDKVAEKMGYGKNLPASDQIVKPKLQEKLVKAKTFGNLSSYLWAAVGVGIAMQKPWENLGVSKVHQTLKDIKPVEIIKDTVKIFKDSCKDFVTGGNAGKNAGIAGKALLGAAIATTILGNISTLVDFNNNKKASKHVSVGTSNNKVVC